MCSATGLSADGCLHPVASWPLLRGTLPRFAARCRCYLRAAGSSQRGLAGVKSATLEVAGSSTQGGLEVAGSSTQGGGCAAHGPASPRER